MVDEGHFPVGIEQFVGIGDEDRGNILVPFLSISGWELIATLSGYTVVVETVFAWPGLGLTAVQAIQRGDLFLMQAIVFVIAFLIVLIGIALDILSKAVDPRMELN